MLTTTARAVLAAAVLALAALEYKAQETAATSSEGLDDDDSDSAPFMVIVKHGDGRRCSASLVTLRTALTSAACARPAPAAAPLAALSALWVLAPGTEPDAAPITRRIARVAYAAGGDYDGEENEGPWARDPWAGAAADLALVELQEPMPAAQPILMATTAAECAPPVECHAVRARAAAGRRRTQLRIENLRLEPAGQCAARGPRWAALRQRSLCLTGSQLCMNDRGAGVVCGGKLCGVLSRSAAGDGGGADSDGGEGGGGGVGGDGGRCGDAHAAASVPRWRRFLHCAHTRGACGRDGDCAQLCTEQWLVDVPLDASESSSPAAPLNSAPSALDGPREPDPWPCSTTPPSPETYSYSAPLRTKQLSDMAHFVTIGSGNISPTATPTRTPLIPRRAALSSAGAAAPHPQLIKVFEFEPNRADFNMTPARTTRVYLKAGEYGENAAEYAAEDAPVPARSPAPPTRSAPPAAAAAPSPGPRDEARVAPTAAVRAPLAAAAAAPSLHLRVYTLLCFILFHCLI